MNDSFSFGRKQAACKLAMRLIFGRRIPYEKARYFVLFCSGFGLDLSLFFLFLFIVNAGQRKNTSWIVVLK